MDYYKLKVLNHKKAFILITIVLVLLVGGYFYYYEKDNKDFEISEYVKEEHGENEEISVKDEIYVDIKGYVAKPGVYSFKISDNARINDLILKAGGLKKDADTSTINLSKKLEDEMAIIIYSKSEIQNYVNTKKNLESKLEICEQKLKNNACLVIEEKKKENVTKVNINNAGLSELMTLTGIGEAKAKAIMEYRKKNAFKKIEDIKNVDGIGDSLFESIKESITV